MGTGGYSASSSATATSGAVKIGAVTFGSPVINPPSGGFSLGTPAIIALAVAALGALYFFHKGK